MWVARGVEEGINLLVRGLVICVTSLSESSSLILFLYAVTRV